MIVTALITNQIVEMMEYVTDAVNLLYGNMSLSQHTSCFQAVPATMTAVSMSQHVIHLQENVIIAIIIASITIAMVLVIDGSMKNVEIIAKYVYEVDCVLIEQV